MVERLESKLVELVTCSVAEVVARIDALRASNEQGLLAFDGDGTLWTGDVGEDVFHYAVTRELIAEPARESLVREAGAFGIDPTGTPSALAKRLFAAYLDGVYPEREACAMMTWCYAGWTREEFSSQTQVALAEAKLSERLNQQLEPVLRFAREVALRVVVVSASPQLIVEQAARLWEIHPEDVIASRPAIEEGRLLPALAAPVPYAEAKVSALSGLVGKHPLLASFGDNVFDLDLLRAARLGVAVRPKPALRLRLSEQSAILVLETR